MPIDESAFTTVTILINSGSSIQVEKSSLTVLAIDMGNGESIGANTYDSAGNLTSMTAVIERSKQASVYGRLLRVYGIVSTSFSAPPTGYGVDLPDGDIVGRLRQWAINNDVSIQFAEGLDNFNGIAFNNTYSGPFTGTVVAMYVTDGDGSRSLMNDETTIELTIAGGTAPNPRINGSVSPVILTMLHGKCSAVISASGAGTVLLTTANSTHPSVDLHTTDTATVSLA
jgi:hypothetical protein